MTDNRSKPELDPNAQLKADLKPEPESGSNPKSDQPEAVQPPESDLPPESEASEAAENVEQPPDDIDEDATELRRRYLLRRFWHTAFRFWTTPGHRIAWLLSAALLVIILLNLAAAYAMNLWNRSI